MRAWDFLKNRAVVASLGAVLIFGVGATFAVSQLTQRATLSGQSSAAATASAATTATAGAGAAATDTATTGSGSGSAPTATPSGATPSPTATSPSQQPTPTGASGQSFHQVGQVASVSSGANSFTMTVASTTYTIVVVTSGSPKTEIQINGVAQTDLTHLQTGMQAEVEGQWRSDGKILAFSVDAQ